MSELEKAKQEVEQVCFAYDKAGDTGDIKDWKGFYDLENKLIEKVKIANQPQLTIRKSIADTLDIAIKGLTEFEYYLWAVDEVDVLVPYDRAEYFRKWSNEEMNAHALAVSYVTGKVLNVELVKVVADD